MKPILKWQYDQIVKELLLLQEHQADPTCPCESEGEMCARKHLLTIEAYAQETLPIEDSETYQDKLTELAEQAQGLRQIEESKLCGHEVEYPTDITVWARDWRKQFETRSLACPVGDNPMTTLQEHRELGNPETIEDKIAYWEKEVAKWQKGTLPRKLAEEMLDYLKMMASPPEVTHNPSGNPNHNPHFERRHYEVIASIIYDLPLTGEFKKVVANRFARRLQIDNPNFDMHRFMTACGVALNPDNPDNPVSHRKEDRVRLGDLAVGDTYRLYNDPRVFEVIGHKDMGIGWGRMTEYRERDTGREARASAEVWVFPHNPDNPDNPVPKGIDPDKYEHCITDVSAKIEAGAMPKDSNPHAICAASLKHHSPSYADIADKLDALAVKHNAKGQWYPSSQEYVANSFSSLTDKYWFRREAEDILEQAGIDTYKTVSGTHEVTISW